MEFILLKPILVFSGRKYSVTIEIECLNISYSMSTMYLQFDIYHTEYNLLSATTQKIWSVCTRLSEHLITISPLNKFESASISTYK